MVARLGSDELYCIAQSAWCIGDGYHPTSRKDGKYILQTLAQPYLFAGSEYRSSASIGISVFGLKAHENVQDPIKRADMALSETNYGRNTYRFFDPLIQSQIQQRAEIDAEDYVKH